MGYIITFYFVTINLVTLFMFGYDKVASRRDKKRIPELTLLGLSLLGGSIGAWAGMWLWRHKTDHIKFKYGLPIIIAFQLVIAIYLTFRYYF